MDSKGREFGAHRLVEVVRGARENPPARLVETIFTAVAEWRGDAPQNDDMTAVAVRITT
jgi:serine phosphatase RsbU (regulator of sigma subunit)